MLTINPSTKLIPEYPRLELAQENLPGSLNIALIPFVKLVGCKHFEIKEDCPWMTINKKQNCQLNW
jgi:hypothetical protein